VRCVDFVDLRLKDSGARPGSVDEVNVLVDPDQGVGSVRNDDRNGLGTVRTAGCS
jgi:hypothetical protein